MVTLKHEDHGHSCFEPLSQKGVELIWAWVSLKGLESSRSPIFQTLRLGRKEYNQGICYRWRLYGLSHTWAVQWLLVLVSQLNGTSTPKGSYSAKTGDNDFNVNSSRYSLSTAPCESNSLSGQVWTKCPTRPDTQGAPRGGCSHVVQWHYQIWVWMIVKGQVHSHC